MIYNGYLNMLKQLTIVEKILKCVFIIENLKHIFHVQIF